MLQSKTIVVTGASRGIGRKLSEYFSAHGNTVLALARDGDALARLAKSARAEGHGRNAVVAYPCDLSDPASVEAAVARIRHTHGRVDVLINKAADVTSKPFEGTTPAEIESLIRTNIIGPLQLIRGLMPELRNSDAPVIVNVSSLAGYKPDPSQTVYSITKAAVNAMSRALDADLRGIRVLNAALPTIALQDGQRGVPVLLYARRLERAIERGESELFLSPFTKWLMRLYAFYPPLMRLR